jgi:hypothetical protein
VGLSFGKRDVAKMAAALEPEYADWLKRHKALVKEAKEAEGDTRELDNEITRLGGMLDEVEEIARGALDAAMSIVEGKAKYTVVGQVNAPDNKGDKVALGWYATAKQAESDGLKLTYSSITHETARAWVLPIHHDTPHSWYGERKAESKADDIGDGSFREHELQRRIEWVKEHPDEPVPEDWGLIPWGSEVRDCPTCEGAGKVALNDNEEREDAAA